MSQINRERTLKFDGETAERVGVNNNYKEGETLTLNGLEYLIESAHTPASYEANGHQRIADRMREQGLTHNLVLSNEGAFYRATVNKDEDLSEPAYLGL